MQTTTPQPARRGLLTLATALTLAWNTAAASSPTSEPGTVRAQQGSSCPVPKGLVVSGVTSTGASLQVAEATADAPGYTVVYVAMTGGAQPVFHHATALPLTLTELLPNTTYTVSVQAKCAGGSSLGNVTTTFTTLPRARRLSARALRANSAGGAAHVAATPADGRPLGSSLQPQTVQPDGQDWAAGLQLYPNPATGSVHLLLPAGPGSPALGVRLLNGLGQLVRAYSLAARPAHTPANTSLDLTGLLAGEYSLQLDTPTGAICRRLVIE